MVLGSVALSGTVVKRGELCALDLADRPVRAGVSLSAFHHVRVSPTASWSAHGPRRTAPRRDRPHSPGAPSWPREDRMGAENT
eukprot:12795436-Alexandrium_andersonii.AAC.1